MPFFTWFALRKAVQTTRTRARGTAHRKGETAAKVLTWPDLVYTELIVWCFVRCRLIGWSIALKAPIEEAANPTVAPNPSKAPWYFLGLQEMLVYFDPWLAGVVFPGLIIVGLMAIPYMDTNPKGNGYFTLKERKAEITSSCSASDPVDSSVILGTFLRGPNWNFFGPYEYWDVHYLLPLNNVNLSEFIFVKWFGTGLPELWLWRELPGIILVILYFVVTPLVFAKIWFRKFFLSMGAVRFQIMMFLLLCMFSLPIKMVLRWTINLKYIVAIPEYFFNI